MRTDGFWVVGRIFYFLSFVLGCNIVKKFVLYFAHCVNHQVGFEIVMMTLVVF